MSAEVTPARRLAYDILRRTFEDGAWTDRAFTAAAARVELDARERAQARRLAYGSVQRRGTTDHFVRVLAGRRGGRIDAAALAALRLGLYELLWSETADHAAVDQAVELAKGGIRRSGAPHGRARAASGFVNALLRRAASRARRAAREPRRRRPRPARRSPTPIPSGSPSCGGRSSARPRRAA